MIKKLTLIKILLAFFKGSNFANAQCNIVSGSSQKSNVFNYIPF